MTRIASAGLAVPPSEHEPEYCLDLAQLAASLKETQPKAAEALDLD